MWGAEGGNQLGRQEEERGRGKGMRVKGLLTLELMDVLL